MPTFFIVLGVAAAVYGVTVMLVGSGTLFFAVWYVIAAALAGTGVALRSGTWARLPHAVGMGIAAVATLGTAAVVATGIFIMAQTWSAAPAGLDYLVVLGAQVRPDGSPSTVLRYRLDTAADYLRENPGAMCIVSGGQGGNEPTTEAACMASYLQEQGIDASRIKLEDRSTSTVENLRFSRELVGGDDASVGIVTNDFHAFRAAAIAKRQGLTDAVGVAAPSDPWFLPNNLLREVLCVWKDALLGNM